MTLKEKFLELLPYSSNVEEIADCLAHQMWAEGTSIGSGEGLEPKEQDIQHLLSGEGWVADEIDIWFDDLQKIWRWSCKIVCRKAILPSPCYMKCRLIYDKSQLEN